MKLTKENLPVTSINSEKVALIKDLEIIGIYVFLEMLVQQGEYSLPIIVNRIKEQFHIKEEKVLKALKVIIDDLQLVYLVKDR